MSEIEGLEGGRILIVEDEEPLRHVLAMQLRAAPDARYEVLTAGDGISGLEAARAELPDLVLLDVMMPGMDGFEVCRRLKTDPRTSRIPVIMLTARTETTDRLHALGLYADDYITKPYEGQELLFRVRNQLRTRRVLLESNALTGLPGNVLIEAELTRRIGAGEKFAFLHIDLDNFKAYNDYYGYVRGDRMIRFTAALMHEQMERHGGSGDFLGHIGGDDFVMISVPERAGLIADSVKVEFDARVPSQYDSADRERGYITVHSSRQGGVQNYPMLSVTILIVTNVGRDLRHSAQVSDIAKELKKIGKAKPGSVVVPDRRSDGSLVGPNFRGPVEGAP